MQASFGNVFKCVTSGITHVCDQNCDLRVAIDPYTAVCRISKRHFATETAANVTGCAHHVAPDHAAVLGGLPSLPGCESSAAERRALLCRRFLVGHSGSQIA